MNKRSIVVLISLLVVAVMALSACQPQVVEKTVEVEVKETVVVEVVQTVVVEEEAAADPMVAAKEFLKGKKVCAVLPGPVNDAGWTTQAYNGLVNLRDNFGMELVTVDAAEQFLSTLKGVTEPEQKRRIVGEKFIRVFEEQAKQLGQPHFLVQGTIYPDVVESSAPDRNKAEKIKSHHNVGGLPEDMDFELVEPLRYLFKDEVRAVGEALGLPEKLVWRQPFPGPGLTVRCLGEITPERVSRLRAADHILQEELSKGGFLGKGGKVSQAFVVLLPVRSVGVMGDQRTYQEAAAIRAVTTEDFMTADWARLPHDLLAKAANRIVNEVDGINRVVYDITSKPPATIEWE